MKRWFCFEWGIDDLFVIRLPFKFGVSFYKPWWQLMFGIALKGNPVFEHMTLEWNFGPFAGEFWRELNGE